jgi:RNA polymerase sigma factor (sigma-70 family)
MWTTDTQPAQARSIVAVAPRRRLSLAGDERLARLVKDGDEQAFATLYERYHQRLYRYCRSILHDDADAQDALQSSFAGAYAALAEGRRDAPLRPWLYRIAYNEAVSTLRRRRPDVALTAADELPTRSAEEQASQRARLALVVSDLSELTERQRGALVMRELSGLSHDEIAVALGVSVGAAKQTIFEARRSLAEFAQGRSMQCEDVCRAVSDGNGRALRGRKIRAHLRDCAPCAAFSAAIPARSRDLRAIAPPLSTFAAASLLRRVLSTGSGHGTGSGAGLAAGATTAAGKAAAIVAASKAFAGVAVVATAAIGVTGVVRSLGRSRSDPTYEVRAGGSALAEHSRSASLAVGRESCAVAGQGRAIAATHPAGRGRAIASAHVATHSAATGAEASAGRGRWEAPGHGRTRSTSRTTAGHREAAGHGSASGHGHSKGSSTRSHGNGGPGSSAAEKRSAAGNRGAGKRRAVRNRASRHGAAGRGVARHHSAGKRITNNGAGNSAVATHQQSTGSTSSGRGGNPAPATSSTITNSSTTATAASSTTAPTSTTAPSGKGPPGSKNAK